MKTFSKIYGLGGLRVGYGVIHTQLAKYVQKVRMPFNVSGLALEGARVALTDAAFVKKSLKLNQVGMKFMKKEFSKMKVPFLPSQGNFLLINTRLGFGLSGMDVFNECLKKGVIFRPVVNYGMPDWLRVTIGTESQNKLALKAFQSLRSSS